MRFKLRNNKLDAVMRKFSLKSGTFVFSSSLFYSIFSFSFCFFCVFCVSPLFINHVMLQQSRRISSFILPLFLHFLFAVALLHVTLFLHVSSSFSGFAPLPFLLLLHRPPHFLFFTSPLVFFLLIRLRKKLTVFLSFSQSHHQVRVNHTVTVRQTEGRR